MKFEATVYDERGGAERAAKTHSRSNRSKGLLLDLAIMYQDDDNNPVAFNYGAAAFFSTDIMKFFFWESNQQGSSTQVADGRYCTIDTEGLLEKKNYRLLLFRVVPRVDLIVASQKND